MPRYVWTPEMIELLRQEYPTCDDTLNLASRLGVTYKAMRGKAKVLGVVRRPGYTQQDIDYIREHYGQQHVRQIAKKLKRTTGAVHRIASKHGFTIQPRTDPTAEVLDLIRNLNAKQWSDTRISREIGCERHFVSRHRKAMGLPCQAKNPESVRRAIDNQRKTLGVRTGGELRQYAYRQFAIESGWPDTMRPRQVQILNILARSGVPMTKKELADEMVITPKTFSNGNGRSSYMGELVRQGFVIRIRRGKQILGKGSGKSVDYYALGPVALETLIRRAKCQHNHNQKPM